MTIDTKRLRELADDAAIGDSDKALAALRRAANPQTVIALLDENLRLERELRAMTSARDVYYAEMRDITVECNKHGTEREALREQLAAMTAARDELFDLFMQNRKALDVDTARRIAELRKVGTP